MITIYRHHARMDWDEQEKHNVDRPYDTPLSTTGMTNALRVEKADIVVSSPMLRCVQSALPCAKGPIVLDARFMEVCHTDLIGPLQEFRLRTDAELPPAFYIRTPHGIPEAEEYGPNTNSDKRYRAAIQHYADKAYRAGVSITIFSHSDCIDSFAAMLGIEPPTEFGCSIRRPLPLTL